MKNPQAANWRSSLLKNVLPLLPGLALVALIAWLGIWSSEWIGLNLLGLERSPISGIMMAIILGLILSNFFTLPATLRPGVAFSVKYVLRLGIILLGIRLSLGDVLRLGLLGIPLILFCIVGAILLVRWLGRRLNLSPAMSTLIAVGTSICGATAIVATGPSIEARDEELTYAIANITIFGLLAMFLYPFLAHALFAQDATAAGLFLGTSIHETAQVAGSALIYDQLYQSQAVLDGATVTKLVRNVLMILIIPAMSYLHMRQMGAAGTARTVKLTSLFPLFILGFLGMALVRTVGDATLETGAAWGLLDAATWASLTGTLRVWAENFLAMAMAAVGLGTSFRLLRGLGLRPFYVGFAASVAVGVLSLLGIFAFRVAGLI